MIKGGCRGTMFDRIKYISFTHKCRPSKAKRLLALWYILLCTFLQEQMSPNCIYFKWKRFLKKSSESCFPPPSPLQSGAAHCMQKSSLTECRPSDEACQTPNLTVKEGGHFCGRNSITSHPFKSCLDTTCHVEVFRPRTVRLRQGEPPHMLPREAIKMVKCNILSLPGGSRRKWHGRRWETTWAVQASECFNQVSTKTWPKVDLSWNRVMSKLGIPDLGSVPTEWLLAENGHGWAGV